MSTPSSEFEERSLKIVFFKKVRFDKTSGSYQSISPSLCFYERQIVALMTHANWQLAMRRIAYRLVSLACLFTLASDLRADFYLTFDKETDSVAQNQLLNVNLGFGGTLTTDGESAFNRANLFFSLESVDNEQAILVSSANLLNAQLSTEWSVFSQPLLECELELLDIDADITSINPMAGITAIFFPDVTSAPGVPPAFSLQTQFTSSQKISDRSPGPFMSFQLDPHFLSPGKYKLSILDIEGFATAFNGNDPVASITAGLNPSAINILTFSVTAVPEPSGIALVAIGLGCCGWAFRKRSRVA